MSSDSEDEIFFDAPSAENAPSAERSWDVEEKRILIEIDSIFEYAFERILPVCPRRK